MLNNNACKIAQGATSNALRFNMAATDRGVSSAASSVNGCPGVHEVYNLGPFQRTRMRLPGPRTAVGGDIVVANPPTPLRREYGEAYLLVNGVAQEVVRAMPLPPYSQPGVLVVPRIERGLVYSQLPANIAGSRSAFRRLQGGNRCERRLLFRRR